MDKNKNNMLGSRSIRAPTACSKEFIFSPVQISDTPPSKRNSSDTFQRVSTPNSRTSKNVHNSPLSRVSQEKFNKEERKKEQVECKGGVYYRMSGRKKITEENGNIFSNQNYKQEPLNFSKKSTSEREITKAKQIKQNQCMIVVNTQQLIQKIESLNSKINRIDKKVVKLEQKNTMLFSENIENRNHMLNSFKAMTDQHQKKNQEKIQRIQEEMRSFKESLKSYLKYEDSFGDKMKDYSDVSKISQSMISNFQTQDDYIPTCRKQIQHFVIDQIRKNNDWIMQIMNKFEQEIKTNFFTQFPSFKSSGIKCSSSAILLRFVESFKVRKNGSKKGQVKIVITDNTYYIDSDGYLLDKDQQYLVDGYGNQIRLQERHLKLLKEEQILQ